MIDLVGMTRAQIADPHMVIKIRDGREDEIKQTYRRLVRENHPDSLMARGVPAEFIKLANDKLAAINNAYDRICAERGLS